MGAAANGPRALHNTDTDHQTGSAGAGDEGRSAGQRSRRHRLLLLLGGRRCRRQLVGILEDLVGALPPAEGGALHAAAGEGGVEAGGAMSGWGDDVVPAQRSAASTRAYGAVPRAQRSQHTCLQGCCPNGKWALHSLQSGAADANAPGLLHLGFASNQAPPVDVVLLGVGAGQEEVGHGRALVGAEGVHAGGLRSNKEHAVLVRQAWLEHEVAGGRWSGRRSPCPPATL